MDIIVLTTLLIKLDDGTERLINYDFQNHKIYPDDVLSAEDAEKVISAIRQDTQQNLPTEDPEFMDPEDLENMVKDIEKQGNYDDSGTI